MIVLSITSALSPAAKISLITCRRSRAVSCAWATVKARPCCITRPTTSTTTTSLSARPTGLVWSSVSSRSRFRASGSVALRWQHKTCALRDVSALRLSGAPDPGIHGTSMSVITAQPAKAVSQSKIVIAAIIGNLLEFYDFTVYSFFALTIAKLFFPAHDPVVSTLLALSAFAIGFVARPVGGFVLGHYADKRGRRAALTLTIFLMAIGSAMIGLAPSYARIGLAAPALIIFARLLQGFAQGGEFGAATATLLEMGSAKGRGFRASWQLASQGAAALMGSGIAALLTYQISGEQLLDWGWRVPFLIGTAIMPVGVYLRRHIVEEPSQAKAAKPSLEPGLVRKWFLTVFAI